MDRRGVDRPRRGGVEVAVEVEVGAGVEVEAGIEVEVGVGVGVGIEVEVGVDAGVGAGVEVGVGAEPTPVAAPALGGYTPAMPRSEPVVRIRCEPEDEARCRAALSRAGFEAERSLSWLVVRDASPDLVNDALVSGGAAPRTVVRARIGQLLGWLLDKEGKLEKRGVNVLALVSRVIEEGGLSARYRPRSEAELLAAAAAVYEHLMASGAGFLSWDRFVADFCEARPAP